MEARSSLGVSVLLRAQVRMIGDARLGAVPMMVDVVAPAPEAVATVEDLVVAQVTHLVDQGAILTLPHSRRMHVTAKFGSASGDVDRSSRSYPSRFAALGVMPTA